MHTILVSAFMRSRLAVLSALAMAAIATTAHADPVLINGSFEQTGVNASSEFGTRYPSQTVTGWTSTGYNFVYQPGAADTTGAVGEFSYATGTYSPVKLWGPGTGANNGLPTTSPDGGNYLAMDGNSLSGPVSQTISGFTPGDTVTISFWYAGAQQYGYTGATTEALDVSLGGQSFETPVLSDSSHGFTGWDYETFTFTPTSATETLSFLAVGTPNGFPPMTLLDGVTLSQQSPVPEPSSLLLLATGFTGLGGMVRRRFSKRNQA